MAAGNRARLSAILLGSALVITSIGGVSAARAQSQPGYGPQQLARAYNFGPLWQRGLKGRGQTIAFMEVDGVDEADLASFNRTFGLPPTRLDVLVPQGSNAQLAPGPETTMDLEYAHALAPEARLVVYEVIKVGDFVDYAGHLAEAVGAAVQAGASVISISLRGTGSILCSTYWAARKLHKVFQAAAAKGITVFAASGDYGDRPCQSRHTVGTVYPAADPYVTAVGGTSLSLTASDTYAGETAWSGSGGGNNHDFSRPFWQTGPGSLDPKYRSIPDVSWVADPQTGALVYLQGRWLTEGGTSLGAPCWAALWALANQSHLASAHKPVGWANPLLYGLANSAARTRVYHDVRSGDNGYWQAGPGWDAVTGWGSPNASALVAALTP